MSETEGIIGYGTTLGYSDTSSGTFTPAMEVINVDGPNMSAGDADFTHMASPDGFKEFKSGTVDPGQITVSGNYVGDDISTLHGLWRTKKYWKITYPDGATWVSAGYLKEVQTKSELDKLSVDITIKLSGKPTFTKGS